MAGAVLECREVSAGYPTAEGSRVVLTDVTFAIEEGEAVVIIGASGSGKSTLLRLMNRFDDPIEGAVLLGGRPLNDLDPLEVRKRVALVPQAPVMFEGTVRDNFLARPKGAALPTDDVLSRLLRDVALDDELLDRDADELSGGEKQRVAIARALVAAPDVLLLDEPTSALDPHSSASIGQLVESLREYRGLTLVIVTHNADLVAQIGGRRFLIADGAVEVDADDERVERFLEAG